MATSTEPTPDTQALVLPFYLVCDVSYSMQNVIGQVNSSLREFQDELAKHPILADKVRFGVLDFSDDARVVVPLCDFSEASVTDHTLSVRGSTSYRAAFELMRSTIETDAAALKAAQLRMFRPAVFFLTDGVPNPGDNWEPAFARLTEYDSATRQGFQAYPLFVPFGMGDADGQLLSRLVHPVKRSKLFMASKGGDAAKAIKVMAEAMLMSVLSSGRSAVGGSPQHVVPSKDEVGPGVDVYDGGDYVEQ
jgi:uncharacterized protein YegL